MDKNVQKTIDDIHTMVANWKKFWLSQYTEEGPNDWILEEFTELILGGAYYQFGIVSSAVDRLLKDEFINETEHELFWNQIYAELDDVRRLLDLPTPKENVITLDK